jgi:hypothetical protein
MIAHLFVLTVQAIGEIARKVLPHPDKQAKAFRWIPLMDPFFENGKYFFHPVQGVRARIDDAEYIQGLFSENGLDDFAGVLSGRVRGISTTRQSFMLIRKPFGKAGCFFGGEFFTHGNSPV